MSEQQVIEEDVEIQTSDGTADAVLYRSDRTAPAVIHFPDGIGTRPSQRQMARRVAAEGFTVLLPNIYYRTARAPFFEGRPDFANEATRIRFGELTGSLDPEAMRRDGAAYAGFLKSNDAVSRGALGVVGLCFTGAFALRIAAYLPDDIAAAASFHGGRLYTDAAESPHTLLPLVKARLYFGHARDDLGMPAEAIAKFETALAEWGGAFESETYDALHGWTVPDSAAYDEPEAERAFKKLIGLLRTSLS